MNHITLNLQMTRKIHAILMSLLLMSGASFATGMEGSLKGILKSSPRIVSGESSPVSSITTVESQSPTLPRSSRKGSRVIEAHKIELKQWVNSTSSAGRQPFSGYFKIKHESLCRNMMEPCNHIVSRVGKKIVYNKEELYNEI